MNHRKFILQLSVFSVLIAGLILILNLFPLFLAHQKLLWSSWLAFIILTIVIYFAGDHTSKSDNPNLFIRFYMFSILIKMLLCLLIILLYLRYQKPEGNNFIFPFFLIYVLFTGFEIYFLSKQAKTQNI